jgi:hypothetical protein
MHPDKVIVATGEHGPKGKVCVWDSQSMETLAALPRSVPSSAQGDAPSLGISSLSFADNPLITKGDGGDLLVAVTEDMLVSEPDPARVGRPLCVSAPAGFLRRSSLFFAADHPSCTASA